MDRTTHHIVSTVIYYKKSYVSISGDYYQIAFDDAPDGPNDPTNVDVVMDSPLFQTHITGFYIFNITKVISCSVIF